MAAETVTGTPTAVADPAARGRRLTRIAFSVAGLGMALAYFGLLWDHAWHTTTPLDFFWSPPHVLLYSGLALVMLTSLSIFSRGVRESLSGGLMVKVPFLAFPLPIPLLLLSVGTLVALLTGMVDQKWHEVLKSAESFYSLPHNFIITGAMVAAFGVRSGATVLRAGREEKGAWGVPLLTAAFVVVFMRLFASFGDTRVEYEARLLNPVLSADPNWVKLQHAYLDTDILANNTLWAPLVLVAALLTPLAYADGLTGKRWTATRTAGVFATMLAGVDGLVLAAGYRPLWTSPAVFFVLPAAFAADLAAPKLPKYRWVVAALVFTGAHGALYGLNPAGIALAAGGGWVAGLAGRGLSNMVDRPTPRRLGWGLLLFGVVFPVLLGGLDILLRYGKYYWLF